MAHAKSTKNVEGTNKVI